MNSEYDNSQINDLLNAVMALAAFQFDSKATLMGESEELDALAAAVNMLGEELRAKVMQLNERENILREIHHRVKNNLQVVSSILHLQSAVIKDPLMVEKFRDCQSRVSSMALVHSQLYTAGNLSELEANAYFSELCLRLHESYERNGVQLHFCGLTHSLYMTADQMLPLGLIASELVMNSYNHAFKKRQGGNIRLELMSNEDTIHVRVEDTGTGFEDPQLFYDSASLGLQLVHSLMDQLDAELVEFCPVNPCRIEISVPLNAVKH